MNNKRYPYVGWCGHSGKHIIVEGAADTILSSSPLSVLEDMLVEDGDYYLNWSYGEIRDESEAKFIISLVENTEGLNLAWGECEYFFCKEDDWNTKSFIVKRGELYLSKQPVETFKDFGLKLIDIKGNLDNTTR